MKENAEMGLINLGGVHTPESFEEAQARLRHSLQVLATYLGITDFNTRFPYPT